MKKWLRQQGYVDTLRNGDRPSVQVCNDYVELWIKHRNIDVNMDPYCSIWADAEICIKSTHISKTGNWATLIDKTKLVNSDAHQSRFSLFWQKKMVSEWDLLHKWWNFSLKFWLKERSGPNKVTSYHSLVGQVSHLSSELKSLHVNVQGCSTFPCKLRKPR